MLDMYNPDYYCKGNVEVIDIIELWALGYHTGSALAYILRAGNKEYPHMTYQESYLSDLKKARWFLNREIGNVEKLLATDEELDRMEALGRAVLDTPTHDPDEEYKPDMASALGLKERAKSIFEKLRK